MPFRRRSAVVVIAAVLVSGAWHAPQVAVTLAPGSTLTVAGTSTVRSWSCDATELVAAIDATGADVGAQTLGGGQAVRTVRLTVPVAKLDCRNGTMNGHMWRALNRDAQPSITFVLQGYDLSGSPAARTGALRGTLRINGTEQAVVLAARFSDAGNGRLRVQGEHVLQMTQYGVKPPTLMLGTMKVGDAVTITFDLLLSA